MEKVNFLLISFFALLAVSPHAVEAAADELPTPTIAINPDVYYPLDEILYLEGRAKPKSTVQIQFQKPGAKPINLNVKSDQNGEWVLAEKVPLDAGDWEVRSRIAQSNGEASPWSNPRILKAVFTGVVLGGFTFRYSLLLFSFLAVLSLSVAFGIYSFLRMRKYQARAQYLKVQRLEDELRKKEEELETAFIDKGKENAKATVEQSFSELKNTIAQELEHIERLAGGRVLNREETEHKENLMASLKNIEEKIASKINTIDQNA